MARAARSIVFSIVRLGRWKVIGVRDFIFAENFNGVRKLCMIV